MKMKVGKTPNRVRSRSQLAPPTNTSDLRVELLWQDHTHLRLPYQYGIELLEYSGSRRLVIPVDAQEVYQWPWRKVQQYYVRLLLRDPGATESAVVRASVAGTCRGLRGEYEREDRLFAESQARLEKQLHPERRVVSAVRIIRVKPTVAVPVLPPPTVRQRMKILVVRKK